MCLASASPSCRGNREDTKNYFLLQWRSTCLPRIIEGRQPRVIESVILPSAMKGSTIVNRLGKCRQVIHQDISLIVDVIFLYSNCRPRKYLIKACALYVKRNASSKTMKSKIMKGRAEAPVCISEENVASSAFC